MLAWFSIHAHTGAADAVRGAGGDGLGVQPVSGNGAAPYRTDTGSPQSSSPRTLQATGSIAATAAAGQRTRAIRWYHRTITND